MHIQDSMISILYHFNDLNNLRKSFLIYWENAVDRSKNVKGPLVYSLVYVYYKSRCLLELLPLAIRVVLLSLSVSVSPLDTPEAHEHTFMIQQQYK